MHIEFIRFIVMLSHVLDVFIILMNERHEIIMPLIQPVKKKKKKDVIQRELIMLCMRKHRFLASVSKDPNLWNVTINTFRFFEVVQMAT